MHKLTCALHLDWAIQNDFRSLNGGPVNPDSKAEAVHAYQCTNPAANAQPVQTMLGFKIYGTIVSNLMYRI